MSQKLENPKNIYLEGIRDGRAREAVTQYTGDHYTQHSTGQKAGRNTGATRVEGYPVVMSTGFNRNFPMIDSNTSCLTKAGI